MLIRKKDEKSLESTYAFYDSHAKVQYSITSAPHHRRRQPNLLRYCIFSFIRQA
jgi:hypothetical protein